MKKLMAYDLPLRIFHWSFALLFTTSFCIGKFVDDDSLLYSYHMLSGLMMAILVSFRITWGIIGSKHSRFSSMPLAPRKLLHYLSSLFTSTSHKYLGHNPASSYAMLLMFLLTFSLLASGLGMVVTGNEDPFEDLHELFAHGFLVVVILHIIGVLLHHFRHKDGMISSMLNGRKRSLAEEDEIKSAHPLVAGLFVIIIGFSSFSLFVSFDKKTRYLSLMGTKIFLGEPEEGKKPTEQDDYGNKDWNNDNDDHTEDD